MDDSFAFDGIESVVLDSLLTVLISMSEYPRGTQRFLWMMMS